MSPKLVSLTSGVVLTLALGTLVTVPMRFSGSPATSPQGLSLVLPGRPPVVEAEPVTKRVSRPARKPQPPAKRKPRAPAVTSVSGSPPPPAPAPQPAPAAPRRSVAPPPAPAPAPAPPPAPAPVAAPPVAPPAPAPGPVAVPQGSDETCVDVERKDNPGKHKGWAKDSPCDHDQGVGNDGREHGRGHGRKS